jgi:hypothetical protein
MEWVLVLVSFLTSLIEHYAHNSVSSQLITNVMAGNVGITIGNVIPQFTTNEPGVTIIAGEYSPVPVQLCSSPGSKSTDWRKYSWYWSGPWCTC